LYVTAWTRFWLDPAEGIRPTEGARIPMDEGTRDLLVSLIDFVDDADRSRFVEEVEALRVDEERGRYPQPVRRNLTWDEYARISARLDTLDPWVEIRESSRRFYPEGELTAFVTGHM